MKVKGWKIYGHTCLLGGQYMCVPEWLQKWSNRKTIGDFRVPEDHFQNQGTHHLQDQSRYFLAVIYILYSIP